MRRSSASPRPLLSLFFFALLPRCHATEPVRTNDWPEPSLERPEPPVDRVLAGLEGLPFDAFLDASFKAQLVRDPELVSELGLSPALGLDDAWLTDLSEPFAADTHRLEDGILRILERYETSLLSFEQRTALASYRWYLEDRGHGFEYRDHDYPATHFLTGLQIALVQLFTDLHPMRTARNARDYVARLSRIDHKIQQLLEGIDRRAQKGVILPKPLIRWAVAATRWGASGPPKDSPFFGAYAAKVDALLNSGAVDARERDRLLAEAEDRIRARVLPAYGLLIRKLQDLEPRAPSEIGVGRLPNGSAYYAWTLRHHTTTELDAEQIHQLGISELARIQTEIRARFTALGYSPDWDLRQSFARLAQDSGVVTGDQIVPAYEAIIRGAERRLDQAFDVRPHAPWRVIGGSTGGYYVAASLDHSRPGAFYALTNGPVNRFEMPTLAYHESIPGHHLQIAIAQEQSLPLFSNVVVYTGYVEGWALYAERLASELGWYADDPQGDLGRLQAEAFRAVRLVVDTGIHAKGWAWDQAVGFMSANTGYSERFAQDQIARYSAWPGQSCAYLIGMLDIARMRARARAELGDRFDLKKFHRTLLLEGALPLAVFDQRIEGWIDEERGQ